MDGTHQGGLSGPTPTTETITAGTLEAEGGSVQQDLGTIGKRELAVAQSVPLGDVKVLGVAGDLTNPVEGSNDPTNNATSFGVTDGSLELDQIGKEFGDGGVDGGGGADELSHVVSDDGNVTFGGSELLVETARERNSRF